MSKDFMIIMGVIAAAMVALGVAGSNPAPHRSHTRVGMTERVIEELKTATRCFEEEYSRLPDPGVFEATTDSPEGRLLLVILLGSEREGDAVGNPRRIRFLGAVVKQRKERGGLVYETPGSFPGLYDAWGEPFHIFLREPTAKTLSFIWQGKTVELDATPIAIVSKGPDKIEGSADDLRSWQ